MADFRLKSSQFRSERERSWVELESLIDRLENRGARALSSDELMRLPLLYRSAASSLSVARSVSLDANLLTYLESLVGRAYIAVYARPRSPWEAVRDFVLRRFPAAVRRSAAYLLLATLLLGGGMFTGWALVMQDIDRYYSLMPEAMAQGRTPASTPEELREVLYGGDEDDELESLQVFAAYLFTHNAKIGILSFALGFVAGAPTAFLMFYNGLILGSMGALYQHKGLALDFWAWVLPHGVTELGAVLLCGMAGFVLGMAVVFPGRDTRLRHLARRGREMGVVVLGCVGMFFIAALIEGFFRQLVESVPLRAAMTLLTLAFWTFYFLGVGRYGRRIVDG